MVFRYLPLAFMSLCFLSACSSSRNSHHGVDPCVEMVREADGIREVEKQLAKNEDRIKKDRASGDTAALNSELRMREALREKKKYAQFAADKMRADCTPALFTEPPPVDRTRYREERLQGK